MNIRFSLLLFIFLVVTTSAAKVVETIIQPNETTHFWYDRFASLKDLLNRYPSFKYKDPTTFMIRVPADATVKLDQIYSFGVGSNAEIVFLGGDRATSKLEFADFSSITMNTINLKLSNLSVVGYDRSQLNCYFCASNGSIDIQNLDIYLSSGPILEKNGYPANFLSINTALQMQNVQAVFNGSYSLLQYSKDSPNITIQNSEFMTSNEKNFIFSVCDDIATHKGSLLITNTTFRMTQMVQLSIEDDTSFITLKDYNDATLANTTIIFAENAKINLFFRTLDTIFLNITNIKFEVVHPTARFAELFYVARNDIRTDGAAVICNINLIGYSVPTKTVEDINNLNVFYFMHYAEAPLEIQNITISNMIIDTYKLLVIRNIPLDSQITGIRVLNSTVKSTMFEISQHHLMLCSSSKESDTVSMTFSGIEISDSEITYENEQLTLVEFTEGCESSLKFPFLSSIRLNDLKFNNNKIISRYKHSRLSDFNFIVSSKWNLIVEDALISNNEFNQFTLFKIKGPQPIIRFSALELLNNTFNNSVFLCNPQGPQDFLVYLEYNETGKELQLVRNYRYVLIEKSYFYNLDLNNSVLFQGNFINFIFQENGIIFSELSGSLFIDLRYRMLDERPAERSLAPEFLFNASEQPDWFQIILKGQPTIAFLNNTINYVNLDRSVVINALEFDFLYNFKRFYSQILIEDNRMSYMIPSPETNHNLFNFMHSGNVIINNNEFINVFTIGVIFHIVYQENSLPGTTFATDHGKFIFTSNVFTGRRAKEFDSNSTAILELNADRIQEIRFENNSILSCIIIDRGFVDIKIKLSPIENIISLRDNIFSYNVLVAGNNLRTNFLNFQLDPEFTEQPKEIYIRSEIQFYNNSFTSNTIDGEALLTGSLMAVTPSLVQIKAPDYSLYVSELNVISSIFKTYGYLFTAISFHAVVEKSSVLGCTFHEEERFISMDSQVVGAQGIFFFSSPTVVVHSSELSSNTIQRGSYFVLDNFWSRAYYVRPNPDDYEETIVFELIDCNFVSNRVRKGAIIMYSGGYFNLEMGLENIVVRNENAEMEHFLWISDPRFLYLKIKNASFEITPEMEKNRSPHLFYFNEYDAGTNKSTSETKFPIQIINCTFYLSSSSGSPNPPRITFINSKRVDSIAPIRFSGCNFFPITYKAPVPQPFQYNIRFEFSGSKIYFENCQFIELYSLSSVFFDIHNASEVRFTNTAFSGINLGITTLIKISNSSVTLNQIKATNNELRGTFVLITGNDTVCTVQNSHFVENALALSSTLFRISQRRSAQILVQRNFLTIQDSVFMLNKIGRSATGLRFEDGSVIITNSSFVENDGHESSSPIIKNRNEAKVEILSSFFANNSANSSTIETTNNIELENSTFIRHLNTPAGTIKFTEDVISSMKNLTRIVENNSFLDGFGRICKDYVGYADHLEYIIANLNISTRVRLATKERSINGIPIIGSFYPGAKSGIVIDVTIHDTFGNQLEFRGENAAKRPQGWITFKRYEDIHSSMSDQKGMTFHENIPGVWRNGFFSFNASAVLLIAPLNWYTVMEIKVNFEHVAFFLKFALQATSSCGVGWVFDKSTLICKHCLPGKYSRIDSPSAECLACPAHAKCDGGYDNVEISKAYWANMSAAIINPTPCANNPDACRGGVNSSCASGYYGLACEDCDYFGVSNGTRYYSAGFFECNSCPTSYPENVSHAALAVFIAFIVEIIFVAVNVISNQKIALRIEQLQEIQIENAASYVRALITYFQFLCIMRMFDIRLPNYLDWTLFIGDPLQAFANWSQCMILMFYPKDPTTKLSLPYYTFNLTIVLLLFKCAIIMIVWGLLKLKLGDHRVKREHLISALISLFILLQPSLTSRAFSIISCKTIDGQSYLDYYPSFQCYTTEHWLYFLLAGIPMLIIIGLVIPGAILRSIMKARENQQYVRLYCGFGALLAEYEPQQRYYWGLILLELKFVLIVLSSFIPVTSVLDHKIKSLLLIMILAFYLLALIKLEPHLKAKLRKMDIHLVSLDMAIIFFIHWKFNLDSEVVPDGLEFICSAVIIGANVIVIGYALFVFFPSKIFGSKDASVRSRPEVKESILLRSILNDNSALGQELLSDKQD